MLSPLLVSLRAGRCRMSSRCCLWLCALLITQITLVVCSNILFHTVDSVVLKHVNRRTSVTVTRLSYTDQGCCAVTEGLTLCTGPHPTCIVALIRSILQVSLPFLIVKSDGSIVDDLQSINSNDILMITTIESEEFESPGDSEQAFGVVNSAIINQSVHQTATANTTTNNALSSSVTTASITTPTGESLFETEHREVAAAKNTGYVRYFGQLQILMQEALVAGGSELALGHTLFSLIISTRSRRVLEIGTFKGFSTLSIASALKYVDVGWDEPMQHKQRSHQFSYKSVEEGDGSRPVVITVDPVLQPEAVTLWKRADVTEYIETRTMKSSDLNLSTDDIFDIIFIDGDHSYEGCRADVRKFIPRHLAKGGYFILHDYYGWFDSNGKNNSPIKAVVDEIKKSRKYEQLLIDSRYMSFVIFRDQRPR